MIPSTDRLVKSVETNQLQEEIKRLQQEKTDLEISLETSIQLADLFAQQLLTRSTELEQRNLEVAAFARTVAHDLKNPLGGMMGVITLLQTECIVNQPISNDFVLRLQWLDQGARQLHGIIQDLLLLAGVSQKGKVETYPLDMTNIVRHVIRERLPHLLEEYKGTIELPPQWELASGYAPWVEGIWANYLSNGLKYGGRPPHLILGSDKTANGELRFWVKDNGKGVPAELQERLFTPFTRLPNRNWVEGTGLGLSIVQQIVTKLGGCVGMEDQEIGSLFYFTLPAATLI
ncbi:sensor histidine kinase [Beggiatoa leptomitoformis]|uniref:histidine kinase n=1 Tax=Beggiatoa leptomitoformis TaxID=288004 RepID=A0A2N9YC00_9GAMM|nr:HAMP domain-containing sensor histidine kinase [Beggiatoa leptomitoformis]AUI67959.1 hybrid sensor histidine kinase/response regulator [Beggiatoa leptomitoformis]QGX03481.1 hybrid sensor histidine kinase/response regulator [Beggiatoa leptomitoformis]